MDAAQRFWSKVDIRGPDECWPWMAARNKKGYGLFRWQDKTFIASRAAWLLTYGDLADLNVLHHCDNPPCVNIQGHLFLGTAADNQADMVAKGRWKGPRGERHANAKLTTEQANEIRALHTGARGDSTKLAREFGVDRTTIARVVASRTYLEVA